MVPSSCCCGRAGRAVGIQRGPGAAVLAGHSAAWGGGRGPAGPAEHRRSAGRRRPGASDGRGVPGRWGTPVEGPPGVLKAGDEGFLVAASDLGRLAAPTVREGLRRLNADAVSAPKAWGSLVALPDGCDGPRPLVAVGRRGECMVLCRRQRGGVWPVSGRRWPRAPSRRGQACRPCKQGRWRRSCSSGWFWGWPRRCRDFFGPGRAVGGVTPAECSHRRALPLAVLAEAVRHLEACYPEEGCGVVLEGAAGPRWVPLNNAYAAWAARDPRGFPRDARSAFLFEPAEWLALLKQADARGERPVCIVHGHPDGAAAFSAEDRQQAAPEGRRCCPAWTTWWWPCARGERRRRPGCVGTAGASSRRPFSCLMSPNAMRYDCQAL